jgi:hypothetical protein
MSKQEASFLPRDEAEQVRKSIAHTGREALAKLAAELKGFGSAVGRGRKRTALESARIPEDWVRNFKAVADQLRRDYRLEPIAQLPEAEDLAPEPAADDPLAGLRLVSDEEAA